MAGDWLKVEVALPEKPEVWRIASTLGLDTDTVVGKLVRVWRWFDLHTEDGNAVSVSPALVDCVAGVSGFADAMRQCDWLIVNETGLQLPNFDRHNGKTSKNRALAAQRAARHKEKSNAESNAITVTDALPREEKRREEEETKKPPGKREAIGIKAWLESLPPESPAIPPTDPLFAYAESIGLPAEMLELAWTRFVEDMADRNKRQKDWRAHFRNAVRGNWFRLWWLDPATGTYRLTTVGEQARRAS